MTRCLDQSLSGSTPAEAAGKPPPYHAVLDHYAWQQHCRGLAQIKGELETNEELKHLYPDILYDAPHKDSPLWSVDKGIVVRRKGNPREATVEAHGVVETQPVGSHFRLMIFDDLVTPASVSTPEQVKKTTLMHALADNLGARGPDGLKRKWHIGTRYHFGDTYQNFLDRKSLQPRIYPATDDGGG